MKIKDIIEAYKNKKQDLKNKHELKEIKKHAKKNDSESGIKGILSEYKNKLKEKDQKEEIKVRQNALEVDTFLQKIVNTAFNNLKDEFDNYGEERTVQLNVKLLQISLTVYYEQKQEYIFRIIIKNDNEFSANLIIYHIEPNGEISTGKEEKLLPAKKIQEITEEDIRKNFYKRYKDYLMSLV